MSRAIWSGAARDDLARIDEFYAILDADYADRVGRLAVRAGAFLADHPRAGPKMAEDIRKWRVPGTRHLLIYRIRSDGVEILRVHHGREDWRRSPP